MTETSYPSPVAALLDIGDPLGRKPLPAPPSPPPPTALPSPREFARMLEEFRAMPIPEPTMHTPDPLRAGEWQDYRALGLGPEHVPELIRLMETEALRDMTADDAPDMENPAVYAPIHAWRALGQLRAEAAIEPLIGLFGPLDDWDWFTEDAPEVFGLIGPAAIGPLSAFLANSVHPPMTRVTASRSLAVIGRMHPETRAAVVAVLSAVIEASLTSDANVDDRALLNGFLISDLIDLEAVETLPVIARAFATDLVDLSVTGDLEEVEIAFGVREKRETPRPKAGWLSDMRIPSFSDDDPAPPATGGGTKATAAKSEKRKRKIAQQSRRINRKKKK